MGTLPEEKLRTYGTEYGGFVATISNAWESLGQPAFAAEERTHNVLWQDFRAELNSGTEVKNKETESTIGVAMNLFGTPETAAGALYAFEAQNPGTTKSKLDGLKEHYTLTEKAQEYFRIHVNDLAEGEYLRERIRNMSEAEFAQTKTACAIMAASMWGTLDGVYYRA